MDTRVSLYDYYILAQTLELSGYIYKDGRFAHSTFEMTKENYIHGTTLVWFHISVNTTLVWCITGTTLVLVWYQFLLAIDKTHHVH